jgi:hypothetical protein
MHKVIGMLSFEARDQRVGLFQPFDMVWRPEEFRRETPGQGSDEIEWDGKI